MRMSIISYGMYIEKKKNYITEKIQDSDQKKNKYATLAEAPKYQKYLKLGDGEVNHKKMSANKKKKKTKL